MSLLFDGTSNYSFNAGSARFHKYKSHCNYFSTQNNQANICCLENLECCMNAMITVAGEVVLGLQCITVVLQSHNDFLLSINHIVIIFYPS